MCSVPSIELFRPAVSLIGPRSMFCSTWSIMSRRMAENRRWTVIVVVAVAAVLGVGVVVGGRCHYLFFSLLHPTCTPLHPT
jgi:hypothetical protein